MEYPQQQLLEALLNKLIFTSEHSNSNKQLLQTLQHQQHHQLISSLLKKLSSNKKAESNQQIDICCVIDFIRMLQIWDSELNDEFPKLIAEILSLIDESNCDFVIKQVITMIILKATNIYIDPEIQTSTIIQSAKQLSKVEPRISQGIQIQLKPLLTYTFQFLKPQTFQNVLILYFFIQANCDSLPYLAFTNEDEQKLASQWQIILHLQKYSKKLMQYISSKLLSLKTETILKGTKKIIYSLALLTVLSSKQYNYLSHQALFFNQHRFFLEPHSIMLNYQQLSETEKHFLKCVDDKLSSIRVELFGLLCQMYVLKGNFEYKDYVECMMKNQMTTSMMGKLYELLKCDFLNFFCRKQAKFPNLDVFLERIETLLNQAKKHIEQNRFRCYFYSKASYIQLQPTISPPFTLSLQFQIFPASQRAFKQYVLFELESSSEVVIFYLQYFYPKKKFISKSDKFYKEVINSSNIEANALSISTRISLRKKKIKQEINKQKKQICCKEEESRSILFYKFEILVEKKKCRVKIDDGERIDLQMGAVKMINIGNKSQGDGSGIQKITKLGLTKIEKDNLLPEFDILKEFSDRKNIKKNKFTKFFINDCLIIQNPLYQHHILPLKPISLFSTYILQLISSQSFNQKYISIFSHYTSIIRKQFIILKIQELSQLDKMMHFLCIACLIKDRDSSDLKYYRLVKYLITLAYPWDDSNGSQDPECFKNQISEENRRYSLFRARFQLLLRISIRINKFEIWEMLYREFNHLYYLAFNVWNIRNVLNEEFFKRISKQGLNLIYLAGKNNLDNNFITLPTLSNRNKYKGLIKLIINIQLFPNFDLFDLVNGFLNSLGLTFVTAQPENCREVIEIIRGSVVFLDGITKRIGQIHKTSESLQKYKIEILARVRQIFALITRFGFIYHQAVFKADDFGFDEYYDFFLQQLAFFQFDFSQNPSYIAEGQTFESTSCNSSDKNPSISSNNSESATETKQLLKNQQEIADCFNLIFSVCKKIFTLGSLISLEEKKNNEKGSMGITNSNYRFCHECVSELIENKLYFDWGNEEQANQYENDHRMMFLLLGKCCWDYFINEQKKLQQSSQLNHLMLKKLLELSYPIYNKNLIEKILLIYLQEKYSIIPLQAYLISQLNSHSAKQILLKVLVEFQKEASFRRQEKMIQIIKLFSGIRNCFSSQLEQIDYPLLKLKDEYKEKEVMGLLKICKILDVLEILSKGRTDGLDIDKIGRGFGLIQSIIESLESIASVNSLIFKSAQLSNNQNIRAVLNETIKYFQSNQFHESSQKLRNISKQLHQLYGTLFTIFKHIQANQYVQPLNPLSQILLNKKSTLLKAIIYINQAKQLLQNYENLQLALVKAKQGKKMERASSIMESDERPPQKMIILTIQIHNKLETKYRDYFVETNSILIKYETEVLSVYHQMVEIMDTETQRKNQLINHENQQILLCEKYGLYELDNRLNYRKMKYLLKRNYENITNERWTKIPLKKDCGGFEEHLRLAKIYKQEINYLINLLKIRPLPNYQLVIEKQKTGKDIIQTPVCLVTINSVFQGTLKINTKKNTIEFQESLVINEELHKSMHLLPSERRTLQQILNTRQSFTIKIQKIRKAYKKKYLHEYPSLEIFLLYSSYFFVFASVSDFSSFIKSSSIQVEQNNQQEYNDQIKDLLYERKMCLIDSFEFLVEVNNIGGRSINDQSQYYVFPWTLFKNMDQQNKNSFGTRKLSEPLGKMNPKNFQVYSERFQEMKNNGEKPCYYGTFYSNPGILSNYLLRISPFTISHFQLHGNHFDCFDRLFMSFDEQCECIFNNIGQVSELIPQFYYFPEFLRNRNNCKFTHLQISQEFRLPDWVITQTPEQLIFRLRKKLQNFQVSCQLGAWIELIFGYKSQYESAHKFHNVYLDKLYKNYETKDDADREMSRVMRKQFGQVPKCIFKEQAFSIPNRHFPLFDSVFFEESNTINKKELSQRCFQLPECNGPEQIYQQKNCLIIKSPQQIYVVPMLEPLYKIGTIECEQISQIASLKITDPKSNEFSILFLLKKHCMEIEMVVMKLEEGNLFSGVVSYESKFRVSLIRGNNICGIEAFDNYLIWADGPVLNYIQCGFMLNKSDMSFEVLNNKLQFTKKKSIYLHRQNISMIRVAKKLGLIVTLDIHKTVSLTTILYQFEFRSLFTLQILETSQNIRQILIHELGVLLFLTDQNRVFMTNYYGDIVLAMHFKCEPIRSIKFLNPQWDSIVIFLIKDTIYQADLFQLIQIIKKDESGDFGLKIPTKHHIKKIDVKEHSTCLKMPIPSKVSELKGPQQTSKHPKTFRDLEIVRQGRYWIIYILCSDGTISKVTSCKESEKSIMNLLLRRRINSNYEYKNIGG